MAAAMKVAIIMLVILSKNQQIVLVAMAHLLATIIKKSKIITAARRPPPKSDKNKPGPSNTSGKPSPDDDSNISPFRFFKLSDFQTWHNNKKTTDEVTLTNDIEIIAIENNLPDSDITIKNIAFVDSSRQGVPSIQLKDGSTSNIIMLDNVENNGLSYIQKAKLKTQLDQLDSLFGNHKEYFKLPFTAKQQSLSNNYYLFIIETKKLSDSVSPPLQLSVTYTDADGNEKIANDFYVTLDMKQKTLLDTQPLNFFRLYDFKEQHNSKKTQDTISLTKDIEMLIIENNLSDSNVTINGIGFVNSKVKGKKSITLDNDGSKLNIITIYSLSDYDNTNHYDYKEKIGTLLKTQLDQLKNLFSNEYENYFRLPFTAKNTSANNYYVFIIETTRTSKLTSDPITLVVSYATADGIKTKSTFDIILGEQRKLKEEQEKEQEKEKEKNDRMEQEKKYGFSFGGGFQCKNFYTNSEVKTKILGINNAKGTDQFEPLKKDLHEYIVKLEKENCYGILGISYKENYSSDDCNEIKNNYQYLRKLFHSQLTANTAFDRIADAFKWHKENRCQDAKKASIIGGSFL